MALSVQSKQAIINEINNISQVALSAIIADISGISASKMTELRNICFKDNIYIRVVRNTLLCRAVQGTKFDCLKNMFIGPTLIAYSMKHPGSAARLFIKFARENKKFEIKIAAFEGKLILPSQIDHLATIPTYEEAIIRLILTVKETILNLIRTINAIKTKKEVIES